MVLQDTSLLKMSLDEWNAATATKVRSTWNLHEASLQQGLKLDMFVLLSSMCGIVGMPGLAIYACTNTFLDSFVQCCHVYDPPASVINVGAVQGIGWTAENPEVFKRSRWLEGATLTQEELFQAVSLAIAESFPRTGQDLEAGAYSFLQHAQVINGFRAGSDGFGYTIRNEASSLDRRFAIYAREQQAHRH
ncbi:KR domain-containing protein [Paramyrothecium foliicola]|nr:KR domain-containing protein [Paramyrothecium foliicola]